MKGLNLIKMQYVSVRQLFVYLFNQLLRKGGVVKEVGGWEGGGGFTLMSDADRCFLALSCSRLNLNN